MQGVAPRSTSLFLGDWGLGGGCFKYLFCCCVVLLTVSQESRFGRRAFELVVAFRVRGLGCECWVVGI